MELHGIRLNFSMFGKISGRLPPQYKVIHIVFGAMYAIRWYLVAIKAKEMSLVTTSQQHQKSVAAVANTRKLNFKPSASVQLQKRKGVSIHTFSYHYFFVVHADNASRSEDCQSTCSAQYPISCYISFESPL